jgi:GMP synthase-like glutamine amidotransferase
MKILIISTCKERMHEEEFVKPIVDIVKSEGGAWSVTNYKKVNEREINSFDKIIISGTSLKDFDYNNYLSRFSWIKNTKKQILGICAGMQIIIATTEERPGEKLKQVQEIGQVTTVFSKDFLGIKKGNNQCYELHRIGVGRVGKNFDVYAKSNGGIQAIKHRMKEIYGVMFHPEVRNKEMIREFLKL